MREVTADFEIHVGDRRPFLTSTLTDGAGDVIDLTAADGVTFAMRSVLDDSLKVDDVAGFVDVDPTTGIVEYRWATGDTDTAGDFVGTFTVEWDDGRLETFPNRGAHLIRIHPETGA